MNRKRTERSHTKYIQPETIAFSMFSSEDMKKLCVTKIVTPLTFDSLGYPVNGGLYDKLMGPLSDKDDPCGTCLQNIYQCSGHFGYIELALPAVNPLFHKMIGTIVKITCLSCFQIQLPGHVKYSLILQMKLLNCDLVTEALEISNKFGELLAKYESLERIPEEEQLPTRDFELMIQKIEADTNFKPMPTKNTEFLRNEIIANVLHAMKSKKACAYCRQPLDKVQSLKNKIIITSKRVQTDAEGFTSTKPQMRIVTPDESRVYLRRIWGAEKQFLTHLAPVLGQAKCENPTDVFFLDIVPVTPPSARPINLANGRKLESPQSEIYKTILQTNLLLNTIMRVIKSKGDTSEIPAEAKAVYSSAPGQTAAEKMNRAWEALQNHVNTILDHEPSRQERGEGLKQIIEKKQGIIRMHMMGKRVNFSARSVITPDPNLNIEEIGVPEAFAKHLSYPVPVTPWNVAELRKMVLNGPNVHPGALMIEYEDGTIVKINPADKVQQESIMKRLLTPGDRHKDFRGLKTIYRHLCNGDVLLLNRQPTLHRPSIMAHTARILKGEKTFRLHYANCKAYNADFDGDEMNAHFPQNELARSEGYNLAHVCYQYLVPKDGTPLSGLIQDHMIAGVKLSIRGRFFTKIDYQQLVYQGLGDKVSQIRLLEPAIIKPKKLWSGKQVLSTVILNVLPQKRAPINLAGGAKIGPKAWERERPRKWKSGGTPMKNDKDMSEAEVIIRQGELLVGVLDKMHYGATPYGLVHCVYELYGGSYATKLLSAFTKLFTYFLQREGFTLGVHDILVKDHADERRSQIIRKARLVGRQAVLSALDLPSDLADDEIAEKISELTVADPKIRTAIDRHYKTALDEYTNRINRTCLPAGLLCAFPDNNLQLMVQSGAKGSTVNTMQISCLLGQIELEGKRPPVMISGKSLPSFPAFEFAPRAGGFIDGRFMTGIRPQEFFFHCMAGREGLIDTAVKTSRSGYLQRCLVKHLEGLTVGYDLTVRDSDKSVVQFFYGEDGMDIAKAQFLNGKQLPFLAENCGAIVDKEALEMLKKDEERGAVDEHVEKLRAYKRKHGDLLRKHRTSRFATFSTAVRDKISTKNPLEVSKRTGRDKLTKKTVGLWRKAGDDIKNELDRIVDGRPEPTNSLYQPDSHFGSLNERLTGLMDEFGSSRHMRKKKRRQFEDMLKMKAMQGLCAPGEPVGLLAAQSVGEPSTQMTLNTFHFAGRGEMNVTLGIPRLREILMGATKNLKTPCMEIPFLDVPNVEKEAERLKRLLTRVTVADVLEKIEVTSRLDLSRGRQQTYRLRFSFLPHELYRDRYNVRAKGVIAHMSKRFFGEMFMAIRKFSKINSNLVVMQDDKKSKKAAQQSDDERDEKEPEGDVAGENVDDSSDEEPEDVEDAKTGSKYQQTHDSQEPEGEEEVEVEAEDEDSADKEQDVSPESEAEAEQDAVISSYNYAQNYSYDTKEHSWCELQFGLPLMYKKIDLTAILKDTTAKSVLWETPQIRRAITYENNGKLMLRTDGININEMSKYDSILDLSRLYSNDIHKVAQTYGIEAATRVIVKEVTDVFNVYGIVVDPRHLLLIADYMTFNGSFEPLNRKGMASSVSPMQQMSFESSLVFLKSAVIGGKEDVIEGPTSCLMVGKPCRIGTGCFDLYQKFV